MSVPSDFPVAQQRVPSSTGGGWAPPWRHVVATVVVLALVGLAVGFLWEIIAPRLAGVVVASQPKNIAIQTNPESEAFIAADGWFCILGAIVGVLSAAALWFLRDSRGPVMVLVLIGASLLCAVIGWRFGVWLGRHPTSGQVTELLRHPGRTVHKPLHLRAKAALFVQPIVAVVVTLLCAAFSSDPEPQRQLEAPRPYGSTP